MTEEKRTEEERRQILPLINKKEFDYFDAVKIVEILRGENGCPWDREQTHQSIRANAVEEAYELVDAINRENKEDIIEEMGDMLLQFLLHAQIAQDNAEFTYGNVYNRLCNKLISRHTHVFGGDIAQNAQKALSTWENNKLKAHNYASKTEYLKQVPFTSPSLLRAQKVQSRAAKSGMDFADAASALKKAQEELAEVQQAAAGGVYKDVEEEIGDLLFACVNAARFLSVDAETALSKATQKFISRFEKVENALKAQDLSFKDASPQKLDMLWEEAKK